MSERRREDDDAAKAARLRQELRALGRSLDAHGGGGSGGDSMAERVIAQILAEQLPPPVTERTGPVERLHRLRRGLRMRWRTVTAALCGLLTVLALTPPVRAAVFEWFDFGGVEVRYDPSATPTGSASVPACADPVPMREARRLAGFAPVVPDALGTPAAVSVTREPGGRALLTLCWHEDGRTIRLDEYPALLDPGFAKTVPLQPEWLDVGGEAALWFAQPHRLTLRLTDDDGDRWRRTERMAGPTLLWTRDRERLTLRLEGVASKQRALKIAESVRSGSSGSGT
ncbi:hypothetical protein [Streptomyces kanamyceticus]|uniref:DUF4367 domain-containing protein n=1 Tax=Streptomyces kanamyceticus TaxID=1967 RepID=A0A5J6GU80_STRKN|nr:hypothetical protein [Streptomyces kanamyceticus]QEU97378.1 hypothetical protein CP970_16570 [Streptomyces kanamyceticus]